MRLRGLLEWIATADALSQAAVDQAAKDGADAQLELLAGRDVVRDGGARDEEGAGAVQAAEVEGRHGAARLPEETEQATRPQRGEAALEGRLADRVVHDVDAAAVGERASAGGEVLLRVEDHLVRARLPGEGGLRLRAAGGDHPGSCGVEHLDEQAAGAPAAAWTRATSPGRVSRTSWVR